MIAHGFLYRDGIYTTFDVPGSSTTFGVAINNLGQIVGDYDIGGNQHGFLYSNGVYTTLGVPGSVGSDASAINNLGQIVGDYDIGGNQHGFLYSNGVYTTLDVPTRGGDYTGYPGAINDIGQILGFYSPVPEPTTWVMMLIGFAGLGFAGWHAQRRHATAAA